MSWSRRRFLAVSAGGVLGASLPTRWAHAWGWNQDLVELRRAVGIFSSRGGTIGWLSTPDGALVVDSQYADTAATFLDALRGRGGGPIEALVNTHHHGDHTGGNGTLRSAVPRIVAHERVPGLMNQASPGGSAPPDTVPDTTFGDEWRVRIGDETVRAKHYGDAHTGGDCAVHFEQANVVHMGDLVFNRVYPFIDRPGGASMRGWIDVLERIVADHDGQTLYVFGHGGADHGVTGSRDDVLVQRDYLAAVLDVASRALAGGQSREEAARRDRLPGFPDHVALNERLSLGFSIETAFDELRGG